MCNSNCPICWDSVTVWPRVSEVRCPTQLSPSLVSRRRATAGGWVSGEPVARGVMLGLCALG